MDPLRASLPEILCPTSPLFKLTAGLRAPGFTIWIGLGPDDYLDSSVLRVVSVFIFYTGDFDSSATIGRSVFE